ncbi:17957_t:CDS:1, partial [Funneliformis caledonium]
MPKCLTNCKPRSEKKPRIPTEVPIVRAFVDKFDQCTIKLLCSDKYASKPKLSIEKDGKPSRPSNNFFQFKNTVNQYAQDHNLMVDQTILCNDRNILTKVASELWHFYLTSEQKNIFSELFKLAKQDHEKRFPNYKYKPKRFKSDYRFNLETKSPATNDQQDQRSDQQMIFNDMTDDINGYYLDSSFATIEDQ